MRVGISVLFGILVGVGASAQWKVWLLFENRVTWGQKDPQFHKDIGFYVFQLPFLRFVFQWLFVVFIVVLLVTGVFHYLNGGIRFQAPFQRVTPQVKAHLSVILALMAFTKTAQYWIRALRTWRTSRAWRGRRRDVHRRARAAARHCNSWFSISIVGGVLFLVNIWRRGWTLPIIATGLPAGLHLDRARHRLPGIRAALRGEAERGRQGTSPTSSATSRRPRYGVRAEQREGCTQLEHRQSVEKRSHLKREQCGDAQQRAPLGSVGPCRAQINAAIVLLVLSVQEHGSRFPGTRHRPGAAHRSSSSHPASSVERSTTTPGRTSTSCSRTVSAVWPSPAVTSRVTTAPSIPTTTCRNLPPDGRPVAHSPTRRASTSALGSAATPWSTPRPPRSKVGRKPQPDRRRDPPHHRRRGVELPAQGHRARSQRFGDINLLFSDRLTSNSRIQFVRDVHSASAKRPHRSSQLRQPALSRDPALITAWSWVVDGYTTTDQYPYSEHARNNGNDPKVAASTPASTMCATA